MNRLRLVSGLILLAGVAAGQQGEKARLRLDLDRSFSSLRLTLVEQATGRKSTIAGFLSKAGQADSPAPTVATMDLSPGTWAITGLRLSASLPGGGQAALVGQTGQFQRVLNLAPGENRLRLGGPFRLRWQAVRWGADRLQVDQVHLEGADGVTYGFFPTGRNRKALDLYALGPDSERKLTSLSYG